MEKEKIIAAVIVVAFTSGIAYLFFAAGGGATTEIPAFVKGDTRMIYEWARTPEGATILEAMPCYCGCKYEGHEHTRHCYWKDDGTFDKHGITCSTCLDIAMKAKERTDEGADICSIRKEIDAFYAPNAHLGTDTPMPEGCTT